MGQTTPSIPPHIGDFLLALERALDAIRGADASEAGFQLHQCRALGEVVALAPEFAAIYRSTVDHERADGDPERALHGMIGLLEAMCQAVCIAADTSNHNKNNNNHNRHNDDGPRRQLEP